MSEPSLEGVRLRARVTATGVDEHPGSWTLDESDALECKAAAEDDELEPEWEERYGLLVCGLSADHPGDHWDPFDAVTWT